jgi:hypothetical protein
MNRHATKSSVQPSSAHQEEPFTMNVDSSFIIS